MWFLPQKQIKKIEFALKNTIFDYKIICLQKNIAECMQIYTYIYLLLLLLVLKIYSICKVSSKVTIGLSNNYFKNYRKAVYH